MSRTEEKLYDGIFVDNLLRHLSDKGAQLSGLNEATEPTAVSASADPHCRMRDGRGRPQDALSHDSRKVLLHSTVEGL